VAAASPTRRRSIVSLAVLAGYGVALWLLADVIVRVF
jgi:hypothetical protein